MHPVLAIDGGSTGAAVLASERVIRAWYWRESTAGWLVGEYRAEGPSTRWTASDLSRLGDQIAKRSLSVAEPAALVREGIHVNRRNPQSSLTLAEYLWSLIGGARVSLRDGLPIRSVQPSSWRALLGCPVREGPELKRWSIATVPRLLPGLAEALEQIGGKDHLTDAGGVCLAGRLCQAWIGTETDWETRIGAARDGRRTTKRKRKGRT